MTNAKVYIINRPSAPFNPLLRLENAQKKVLEENDDIEPLKNLNSRVVFPPAADGVYRLVATSYQERGVGAYTITIRAFVRKQ